MTTYVVVFIVGLLLRPLVDVLCGVAKEVAVNAYKNHMQYYKKD